ncbi:hypothetical protein [Gracilibacillus saliphilus]|uniref:hypothetical protein n=1 Tax=Gracilibacillus saliphilus TaxID=543890 RepID=UPI0013D71B6A|nr:hypothetical protein [Gracilibacillus saliphilus]
MLTVEWYENRIKENQKNLKEFETWMDSDKRGNIPEAALEVMFNGKIDLEQKNKKYKQRIEELKALEIEKCE